MISAMDMLTYISVKKRTVIVLSCFIGVSLLLLAAGLLLSSDDVTLRQNGGGKDGDRVKRDAEQQTRPATGGSSVYTRWGREECAGDAELVYRGIVGGGKHDEVGNGANYLCLPHDPVLGPKVSSSDKSNAHVYGAEYQGLDSLLHGDFGDQDVPCVVCKIPRTVNFMLPAKNICPSGWNSEYKGYLVAQYYGYEGKTEFVCLDESPTKAEDGQRNYDAVTMYKAIARCGSLPCPHYEERHVLTCTVCSI